MVASKGTNGDLPFPFDVDILFYCILTASRCCFRYAHQSTGSYLKPLSKNSEEITKFLIHFNLMANPHGLAMVDPRHVRLYLVVYDSVRCRIRSRHCGGFVFIGCACSVSLLDNFKAEG